MKEESWKWLFLFSGISGSLLLLQSVEGLTWNDRTAYAAEAGILGTVRRNIKRASGVSEDFADGVVNCRNIYPAGIEQFRVRVSREPSEEMYLKNFTGGIYADGSRRKTKFCSSG